MVADWKIRSGCFTMKVHCSDNFHSFDFLLAGNLNTDLMKFINTLQFAKKLDREDPLRSFRNLFLIPKSNGKAALYFTGNSLGLQPKSTKKFITEELDDWSTLGVEGHLHSRRPWLYYHKFSKKAFGQTCRGKTH